MTVDHALLRRLAEPAIGCACDFATRRADLPVEEKTRGQFASEADRAVEGVIRTRLSAELGDVPLLGEEEGGALDAKGSGWVIDPIDGTTNFLRGLPIWGIAIGQMVAGEPVAGLIALPELGVVLSAVRGQGVQRDGAPFKRPVTSAAVRLIALGENEHEPGSVTDGRAQAFRDQGFAVARYNCAVFALASAALGWTDGYIERGCSLWDIAAGAVICREAGLSVTMEELAPGRWSIDARG